MRARASLSLSLSRVVHLQALRRTDFAAFLADFVLLAIVADVCSVRNCLSLFTRQTSRVRPVQTKIGREEEKNEKICSFLTPLLLQRTKNHLAKKEEAFTRVCPLSLSLCQSKILLCFSLSFFRALSGFSHQNISSKIFLVSFENVSPQNVLSLSLSLSS